METQQYDFLTKMSWYLDTSLFHDFIERNIRVGFENMEEDDGETILHIRGNKSGSYVPVIGNGKRYAFLLTRTVNHLRVLQYCHSIPFYYSELTKAEIYRSLRKSYGTRPQSEIVNWWEMLRFIMHSYQQTEIDFEIGEELSNLALSFPIRKNAQDYIHLIIAKRKALAFVTLDKLDNQIEQLRKDYYPHIYDWQEIKDAILVPEDWRPLLE